MAQIVYIHNARLLSRGQELKARSLTVRDGKITRIGGEAPEGCTQIVDLEDKFLSPGFIDIQLNGGTAKFFSETPDRETLQEMTDACLEHATPYYYATLITSLPETIFAGIETVREAMKKDPHLLGMHLEGPFLNLNKRGAHKAEFIRKPTDELLDELIARGKGVIKLLTIAPENFTPEQIAKLVASGIQISAGHSEATYEQAITAFDSGIRIVTHLYNAMSTFTHRAPNLMGAALSDQRVYTPIILDGGHCHPGSAKLAYLAKGERLILITDAAVLGRKTKDVPWEGIDAHLNADGFYVNTNGNLAGAAISMPEAIVNAQSFLGVSLAEAVDMATGRVADAIGRAGDLGTLAPGYPAAFSVFNASLSEYQALCFL